MTGTSPDETIRGEEVARLLLPLPVRNMNKLVDYLSNAYGENLSMRQAGQWMLFERPIPLSGGGA